MSETELRYDELDAGLKKVEEAFSRLRPPYNCWTVVERLEVPDGEPNLVLVGFARFGRCWRICYSTGRADVAGNLVPSEDVKPVGDSNLNNRISVWKHLPSIKEAILEAKRKLGPKADEAIQEMDKFIKSLEGQIGTYSSDEMTFDETGEQTPAGYDEAMDAIEKRVALALQTAGLGSIEHSDVTALVQYSAYETDDDGLPFDNLDDVAIKGKCIIHQKHDKFWDHKGGGEDYTSPVLENPTWLQLCVVAQQMIATVGDYHHLYLEGVQEIKPTFKVPKGIKVYKFQRGS